jgi:hypothetical protein
VTLPSAPTGSCAVANVPLEPPRDAAARSRSRRGVRLVGPRVVEPVDSMNELAPLCLHVDPEPSNHVLEQQADEFASAFSMPAEYVTPDGSQAQKPAEGQPVGVPDP